MFALVFSVALYFSFVLMSQDDSVADELLSSDLMSTGFIVGSVFLIVIIVTFVMFANSIFLRRRNRELALFQLIGMTRDKVLRLLVVENAVIYFGSLMIGIAFGFLVYRMLLMMLLRMMQIDLAVGMTFSIEAVVQTALLFLFIFALLMAQNYIFLKKTTLINMLKLEQSSEATYRGMGKGTVIFGVLGLSMIMSGYWLSANMMNFGNLLIFLMFGILFLTIAGTYITFKFSVAFILNMIRKSKNGHVNVNDVLSLTSIMFKMKSNAFLLTLISVVSATSMGLMSLSYIAYYSVEQTIEASVPNDYTFYEESDMEFYSDLLNENAIDHETVHIPTISYNGEGDAITIDPEAPGGFDTALSLSIVSDEHVDNFEAKDDEIMITGVAYFIDSYIDFNLNQTITLSSNDYKREVELKSIGEQAVLPSFVTYGSPQAIVSEEVYNELEKNHNDDEETNQPREGFGIDIAGEDSQGIYQFMSEYDYPPFESKIGQYNMQMQGSGLTMFIIGFVGLAFLLTSGCILYFKQIGESEDEKGSYNILRKLGFTENEIIKGLTIKMAVTFGVPLLIGVLHTYFAVNAGWFLFGNEIWVPMLTVVGAYIILYSVFALISLLYYKKVVKQSI